WQASQVIRHKTLQNGAHGTPNLRGREELEKSTPEYDSAHSCQGRSAVAVATRSLAIRKDELSHVGKTSSSLHDSRAAKEDSLYLGSVGSLSGRLADSLAGRRPDQDDRLLRRVESRHGPALSTGGCVQRRA